MSRPRRPRRWRECYASGARRHQPYRLCIPGSRPILLQRNPGLTDCDRRGIAE
jgi:hypothetical protein